MVPYTAGTTLNVEEPPVPTVNNKLELPSTTATPMSKREPERASEVADAAAADSGLLSYIPQRIRRYLHNFLAYTRRQNYNFFNIFVNSNLYNA